MNLFLNPFFAQRRLYLIQFWLAEHPWRTAAQSFAYAHLESTNRYVCAALKVGRLTSFAMNIDSLNVGIQPTLRSLWTMPSASALSNRLRRLGFRFSNEPSEWIWNLNLLKHPRDPWQNLEANSFIFRTDSLCQPRSNEKEKIIIKKIY